MKQFNIRGLSDEERMQLSKLAKEDGRSVNQEIIHIIREYTKERILKNEKDN